MAELQTRLMDECRLATRYTGVSLIGFAVDALLLQLLLRAGLEPAWARVVSLVTAMQVTFVVNRRHVFRAACRHTLPGQWWRYMASNGFGNFCNYLIFVTMVSSHWPVLAWPMVALSVGSATAWTINFMAARYFVFARAKDAIEELADRYARPE